MRLAPFLLLLALVASGCDSNDAPDDATLRAPGGRTPVAGAIEWRGPSNVMLGTIGAGPIGSGYIGTVSPGSDGPLPDGGAVPAGFDVASAYPNPTNGLTTLEIALPRASEVAVFVVAALPPGSSAPPSESVAQGSWVFRPGGLPVAVIHRGPLVAGYHGLDIDLRGAEDQPFPDGYYRVYVQTPYVIAWTDVLLDRDFYFN